MIVGTPQVSSKSNVEYSSRINRFVPLYDETGSTVAVVSQGSNHEGKFVLEYRLEYDPAGNPRKLTPTFDYDSDQWDKEDPFPFLFAGQRYDAETGLYHTEGGQYHPRLGVVANPAVSGYELPSARVQSITPQEISGPPENFMSFPYNPTIPDARSPIQTIAHTVFGLGGMIPGVGLLFDIADAILYAAEGDYASAGFSLAAAVPIAGDVAAGAKWVKKAQQAVRVSQRAGKAAQLGAKVNSAAKLAGTAIKYRRQASIVLNYGLSGYHVGHGFATGNPWEIGSGILGIGLNSAFAARMLKNAGGARGLLARRNAARSAGGGRLTFDEAAQQFRNGRGELVEFSEVQRVVGASMDRAARRLRLSADDTLARLDADGISLLGRNSGAVQGGTSVTLRPLNAVTRTHAEGEVFQRFFNKSRQADFGVLFVNRGFCPSCGTKGGVGSLLRATGVKRVLAVTPDGAFWINASKPSRLIPVTIL